MEDDLDLRRMFRAALVFVGYQVLEAGDGLDALRILDSTEVHGLVLDLGLPLVPGQVVLQEVAARAYIRRLAVVVVTGMPGPHDSLPVDCLLQKPVTPDRLIATIRRCLQTGSVSPAS